MTPATKPRDRVSDPPRLLILSPEFPEPRLSSVLELPRWLRSGDLLVVNDAATFPAALTGETEKGEPIELRLLPQQGASPEWQAVLFSIGTPLDRTEDRPPPPLLYPGNRLKIGPSLHAQIQEVSEISPRFVRLKFDKDAAQIWNEIYKRGRLVQYSHLQEPLPLESAQTLYASRPWASEMPSAGYPLTAALIQKLSANGILIASLTHSTSLSSTGDPAIDATLPLPEFYEIPDMTLQSIREARDQGGRVVAVGTSVTRALESFSLQPESSQGQTRLQIGPSHTLTAVDAILSGLHESEESHFKLLQAFAPIPALGVLTSEANRLGLKSHEYGDLCLIFKY